MSDPGASLDATVSRDDFALSAAGTSVLLDFIDDGLPCIQHWGHDITHTASGSAPGIAAIRKACARAMMRAGPDDRWPLRLVPGEADAWAGRPGLSGNRHGRAVHPRWTMTTVGQGDVNPGRGGQLTIVAEDPRAGLQLTSEMSLDPAGPLRIRHRLLNTGADGYEVGALLATMPIPDIATEVLDLTGRWCRERIPQRSPLIDGVHSRESRRGRTGHDASLLLTVGRPGFGFRNGTIWSVHAAWSGDHVHYVERLPEGAGDHAAVLGAGELLRPGEVVLAHGEHYDTPWVIFTHSDDGLDGVSAQLHRSQRSRPRHPRSPRPVVFNTWEAAYFDHRPDHFERLAEQAAGIGVERFVVDDGWFLGRRNERTGLGDWRVDPEVWPQGLHPLTQHVRRLNMQFGLWVEPEMVNPDSQLARDHPSWMLVGPHGPARSWRHQQVLDLVHPDAYRYVLDRLEELLAEYPIDFLKWDHNRDLMEAVHENRPGVHAQTHAVYQLLDELAARHPNLEIESCASGGGRIDLGILQRTARVWPSDTNDALERQSIQRWTTLLVPPELVATHVAPAVAPTTGRHLDLPFRTLTALFGHAGIEWDLSTCTPGELDQLRTWVGLYKELRPLLHTGNVVRMDHPEPGTAVHGVVATDRSHAVFAYLRLDIAAGSLPARLRLDGLDPSARYTVQVRHELGDQRGAQAVEPPWLACAVSLTGAALCHLGLQAPILHPGQGILIELRVEDKDSFTGAT